MKSIAEHVQNFQGADVILMSIAFNPAQFVGGKVQTQAELIKVISRICQSHFRRRIVSLPAADGYIFVTDNSAGQSGAPAIGTAQSALLLNEVNAKLRELALPANSPKFEVRVVGTSKAPALTHDEFIAQKLEQRYQHTLNLIRDTRAPPIMFLRGLSDAGEASRPVYGQIANAPTFEDNGTPAYRDHRYEPHPALLAADISLIRGICKQMSLLFDTGEITTHYCSLNFNTVKDNRYWPIYEIEIRNVPSFFAPFMRWELVNVPPGTPKDTIRAVVDRLRPFTENISVCQNGRGILNWSPWEVGLPSVSEMAFYLPTTATDHEWLKILDLMKNYAQSPAARRCPVGLRNAPYRSQIPLNAFGGGVFLSQDESRRMNLVVSEYFDVA